MNPTLPKGFENPPKEASRTYRSAESASRSPQTLNFRGRPGGPGRGMAQTVEPLLTKRERWLVCSNTSAKPASY